MFILCIYIYTGTLFGKLYIFLFILYILFFFYNSLQVRKCYIFKFFYFFFNCSDETTNFLILILRIVAPQQLFKLFDTPHRLFLPENFFLYHIILFFPICFYFDISQGVLKILFQNDSFSFSQQIFHASLYLYTPRKQQIGKVFGGFPR